ncbi:hypothetical protein PYW07_000980 [Mythimna separata]|uniref:Uncharacterized protein n=1 Tax=Mythimna separata TaxID=271217 RepID=A0AAD8DWC1_MYTSE|nr:hypothetical protein PYW07_000980 [Mythimna separata]
MEYYSSHDSDMELFQMIIDCDEDSDTDNIPLQKEYKPRVNYLSKLNTVLEKDALYPLDSISDQRIQLSILQELQISSRLSSEFLRRILQYFGHIARKEGDNLERLIVTGKIDGKSPRERSPIRWSD